MFLFERKMIKKMASIHPRQGLFSTASPGLSDKIGLLEQNWLAMENYFAEDPANDIYEEVV